MKTYKVARGGSFAHGRREYLLIISRGGNRPTSSYSTNGFRVVIKRTL